MILCLFFGEQIFTKATFGHSYISGDHIYMVVPFRTFFIQEMRQGNIPLWNPYWYFGMPMLHPTYCGSFYPLNIFYYILSYQNAFVVIAIVHMLLGGLFLYLFAREMKISKFSSMVSAIIFMFCGFNITLILMHHDAAHAVIAFLPAVFLAAYNMVNKPSLLCGIMVALLIGLQISTGDIIFVIIELIGVVLFGFFLLLKEYKKTKKLKRVSLNFLILIVFISLGFLLNGINILPLGEFLKNSVINNGFCDEYRQQYEIMHLIDVVFFSAVPTYENKCVEILGAFSPYNLFYLGIIPYVLYFFSFFSKNCLKYFFSLILPAIALFFVCGYYSVFFGLINFIPIFKSMRLFLRFYILFVFAIAVCAGMGLDFLRERDILKYDKKRKLFVGICIILNILIIILYSKLATFKQ